MKRIFCCILFLVGCSQLFSQTISNDTIDWSASHKLTWDDFKGSTTDTSQLNGDILIDILANEKKGTRFTSKTTNVRAVFDTKNAWVNPNKQSDVYLKYFQVIFDEGELCARKLRKACIEVDKNAEEILVTFTEKYDAARISFYARIKQFQREAKLGTYEAAINRWADNVKSELAELDAFKLPPAKSSKK